MLPGTSYDKTSRHLDPSPGSVPLTSSVTDVASRDAVVAPLSAASDLQSELQTSPMLVVANYHDISPTTDKEATPTSQQKTLTPPLSPAKSTLSAQSYVLNGVVGLTETSFATCTSDGPLTQQQSSMGGVVLTALPTCASILSAPESATAVPVTAEASAEEEIISDTFASYASHIEQKDNSSTVIRSSSFPLHATQKPPCDVAADANARSRSGSSNTGAAEGSDAALAEPFHADRPPGLAASPPSCRSGVLPTAEAPVTTARGLPTGMSRLSSITHSSRCARTSGGTHDCHTADNAGDFSSPRYASTATLAAASGALATASAASPSEPFVSSFSQRHRFSHCSGFFQSGLLLSLEEDAETQPAAMEAPMTPQNYAQFHGDSALQSLVSSSRHLAMIGDGSPNSTANALLASASAGSFHHQTPQRGVGGTVLTESGGWTALEVATLRNLDDNAESVITGLQPWEGNNESCGGSRGSRGTGNTNTNTNTPVARSLGGRLGLAGGPLTPSGSFNLIGSHAQPCVSAVDPADIPATPTDLTKLSRQAHTHTHVEQHSRRYDSRRSSDDDSDDREGEDGDADADEEDGDAAPEVLETDTLLRARVVSADGHSTYDIINEKYVLYDYELGKGSYSRVHLCYNLKDQRFYAAKVLDKVRLKRRQLGSDYELFKIDQEITIMKQLQHKNIIGLREVIRDPNARYVFLILELAEGKEVLAMKDNGDVLPLADGHTSYAESAVRHLTRGILHALMYAHYLGIAHRDVKPSNVLTTAQNVVKLCDFGVSVLVGESVMQLRREGSVAFLAPELLLSTEIVASRFVSPVLPSPGASRDRTESGAGVKSDSLPVSTSNAATAGMSTSRATEMTEEGNARQDTEIWDVVAPSSARQPLPQLSHASHPHYHHLAAPTATARQTATNLNESTTNNSAGAAGISPLAGKASQRTLSLSSRVNAATVAVSGLSAADATQQYVPRLSATCPESTVNLFKGDVFSLGVTVFTLLLGRLPWRASGASSQLAAMLEEPDPFLRLYKEAYGDAYAWPPAVRETCAPVIALRARHSNLSPGHSSRTGDPTPRSGETPVTSTASASLVASYGAVERDADATRGAERRAVTPLGTCAVTTDDDDDDDAEAVEAEGSGSVGRNEHLQRLRTSGDRCGVTMLSMPPSSSAMSAALVFHRARSLDAAATEALKMTSAHSSYLRSSKASCTPDVDPITTTTLSGTVGSRETPRVVTAPGRSVAAGSETAASSSFWRSVTEGGVGVLPDSNVSNDLSTQWSASRVEQQQHVAEPAKAENSGIAAPVQPPLPQWPPVAVREAGSRSDNAAAAATAAAAASIHLGWMATTATYRHRSESGFASRLLRSRPRRHNPSTDSSPPSSRLRASSIAWSSSRDDKGEVRRPRDSGTLPSALPPLAVAAAVPLATTAAAGATTLAAALPDGSRGAVDTRHATDGSQAGKSSEDRPTASGAGEERGDEETTQGSVDDSAEAEERERVSATRSANVASEASSRADSDDDEDDEEEKDSALGIDSNEEEENFIDGDDGEESDEEESGPKKDDDTDAEVNDDYDYPCEEHNIDDEGNDGSEADIYEQLYEEHHPCRPYTVAESCPLPALGNSESGTRAISAEAVDFVRACLTLDPVQRRTTYELFHHPWIVGTRATSGNHDKPWLHHRSRGVPSFTEEDDDDDDENDAAVAPHRRASPFSFSEHKHQQVVEPTGDPQKGGDQIAGRRRLERDASPSQVSASLASWGVQSTSNDGSCAYFNVADEVLNESEGTLVNVATQNTSPADVDAPRATGAEGTERDGGEAAFANADSATVLTSADFGNAMTAGTTSSLAVTATTVAAVATAAAARGSERATALRVPNSHMCDAVPCCPLSLEAASAPAAAAASESPSSAPTQAVVVPLCHSTKDFLEMLTVQRQTDTYSLRASDSDAPQHARHPSSASSQYPLLSSPCVYDSNCPTSRTGDSSVTATPTTGSPVHHHRLASRGSRIVVDAATAAPPSPVLEDMADHLLLSAVSPSSYATTVNSSSVPIIGTLGRWPSTTTARALTSHTSSFHQSQRRSGKATTMMSHCTVSSSSVATQSGSTAPGRSTRAATTSHVDALLWWTSSDHRGATTERGTEMGLDDQEEEEGEGEDGADIERGGEELSTLTGRSTSELFASSPRASTAEAARSLSLEEDVREGHPPPLPLIHPQEDSALSSPMRCFLEKIAMRDKEQ